MQLSSTALALVGLVFIYQLTARLLQWYRLRQFPGPPLAAFSHLWLGLTALNGRCADTFMAVRAKYSPRASHPFIRIGPNILIHDSPSVHRHINAARSRYVKGEWYGSLRLDPYIHTMFSTTDVAFHDDVKARTAHGYSGREVPSLEKDIDEQIGVLKSLIRRKYLSGKGETKRMDLAKVMNYFTLDTLGKIAFGEEFGYLVVDEDMNGYMKLMRDASPVVAVSADVPRIGRLLSSPFVLGLVGPKATDKSGMGVMMGVAKRVVAKRFGPDAKDQPDMLGSFVRHGLPQRQCEAESLLQITAGSDTTANVLRATLLLLLTAPTILTRLVAEIDAAIAAKSISSPITNAEARGLPYLQAVIYESMRFHPPAQALLPKVVPPEGDTLAGVFIPGGTLIGTHNGGMMRDEETFGADADVFRPERWMEAGKGRGEMEKVVEAIFGVGRYMCAGKTVAFMELNKIFVELLRDFEFQILNPCKPWVQMQTHLILIQDMWVRVTERETS